MESAFVLGIKHYKRPKNKKDALHQAYEPMRTSSIKAEEQGYILTTEVLKAKAVL